MAAKWTFMVYMAGFNNLSEFATKDLGEMRKVGSTRDVKVAVFIKRLEQRSAHHIIVGKDGQNEEREQIGKVDSGDPQTMLDFVRWVHRRAEAERYALVVWNHGSGWSADDLEQLYAQVRQAHRDGGVTARELGLLRSTGTMARSLFSSSVSQILALPTSHDRAIASDDGTGHSLDTIELNRVLKRAHEGVLGRPLDLLGMDACLMSNLEVAYQGEPHVGAIVGSEELEPGDGWPYTRILRDLTAHPDMDGRDLGRAIVRHYVTSYEDKEEQWPVTQCAVDAGGIETFAGELDALARSLRSAMKEETDAARVFRAHTRSTRFSGELVDLRTFCRELRETQIAESVKKAAGSVIDALKPNGYVIDEAHLGETVAGCGGVTAYLPPPDDAISRYYNDLRFARRHGWDEFLRSYHRAFRGA